MRTLAAALVVAAFLQQAAHAQEAPPLPDPAAIAVPDLSGSGNAAVIREGAKYFFFRQEGVAFDKAHADLSECFRYLAPWENVRMNQFVPWVGKPGQRPLPWTNNHGLVGALILGAVQGALQHRDYQAKLRMCMEPRGYVRYGVAEAVWKRVTRLPPEQAIAVQAKIASGPAFGQQVQDK